MPSGFGEVTRWPPRTLWSAVRIASRPAPWRSSSAWPSPPTSADAEEQVLGGDVLVAEPAGLLLGPLDHPLGARVEAQRAALDPGPPGEDRGELAAERGQVDAEPAERLGGDAVVGLDERGEEVLGVEDRALERLGELLGGEDGLLGLLGEAIELHGWSHGSRVWARRVWLVDEVEERIAAAPGASSEGRSAGRRGSGRTGRPAVAP